MVFESFLAFLGKVFCFSAYIKNNDSFPGPLSEEEEREYLEKSAAGGRERARYADKAQPAPRRACS